MDEERTNEIKQFITLLCTQTKVLYSTTPKQSTMLFGLHFYGSLLLKMDEEKTYKINHLITLLCREPKTVY
jgi:hypothetical protein